MSDFLSLIAEARDAALDGRFDDAAQIAMRVVAEWPNCLVAHRILAWAQLELGDDRALAGFQTCAAIDPEDALAHTGQAIWHEQSLDTAAAIQSWTRAWELDPHNQSIRRALFKLSGDLPESLLADGIGLLRADRPDEAAEVLQQASAERPEAAPLARLDALWLSGQWREAFDLALSALAKQPRSVKAMLYVAALEDRTGRTLHSRELLSRAEQSDPGLILFADVVRRIGLQPALDLARAVRGPLLAAR